MPLNLRDYDPVLYHITAKANLTSIRLERKLYSKRRSFLDQRAIAYRGSALHGKLESEGTQERVVASLPDLMEYQRTRSAASGAPKKAFP